MIGIDEDQHDAANADHRRASIWEYGLIMAGLAIVVTFGTHSLSRNMKDSAARSAVDQTTTASIGVKKPAFTTSDPASGMPVRP